MKPCGICAARAISASRTIAARLRPLTLDFMAASVLWTCEAIPERRVFEIAEVRLASHVVVGVVKILRLRDRKDLVNRVVEPDLSVSGVS